MGAGIELARDASNVVMNDEATRIATAGVGACSDQLAIGSVLAHSFEIVRFIRAGGMGEVYEAKHLVDKSRVAVKSIRPDLVGDERIRALFMREAGILRRIRHEAVVGYEGLVQDEDGRRSFLVMSYVDGPSLAERIMDRPLSSEEATILLEWLARGLASVHAEGTFHRDLSPDNILLPGGCLDRAVIIDFGIAKQAGVEQKTLVGGDTAGKFGYMSPEQLGVVGQEVDVRSDIYSLGLSIAAAVLGRPVTTARNHAEVIESRRRVPDLTGIGEPLRSRLAAMLQPNPADRPQTMQALIRGSPSLEDIDTNPQALTGSTSKRPIRQKERHGSKALKSNRLLPILGGLTAFVTAGVLGYLFLSPRSAPIDPVEIARVPEVVENENAQNGLGPEAPQPTIDTDALEQRANQILASLPCSSLSAHANSDGLIVVTGSVGKPSSMMQIEPALNHLEGAVSVETADVLSRSDPVCWARALIETYAISASIGLQTNRPNSIFYEGDRLVVYASAGAQTSAHLYVDYIDPGGDVVHLRPNPLASQTLINGATEVQLGVEQPQLGVRDYQVMEPFGQALIVALASTTPLFPALRSEVEPASDYLAALEEALRNQGEGISGGWHDISIVGTQ